MTSPVKVTGEGIFNVSFFMPSKYTLETLPVPDNSSIKLRTIKLEKVAAIRFSGFFNQENISKNTILLKDYLYKEKIIT
jgi:hypothetical protein